MANTARQKRQKNIFAQQPKINIPRSTFNRSNDRWHTFNVGQLVPIYVDEVIPGDTFKINLNTFARLSTPIFPTMDSAYMDYHTFFVPNRLIWDNWQKFMGEQDNPGDALPIYLPVVDRSTLDNTRFQTQTIYDDMGVETNINASVTDSINNLAARAYRLIFNQWYRDQNYINSVTNSKGDGPDSGLTYSPRLYRGTRADYFTSGLPTAQKFTTGGVAAFPPAQVISNGATPTFRGVTTPGDRNMQVDGTAAKALSLTGAAYGGGGENVRWGSQTGLTLDISGQTVTYLRQAMQMQQFLETDNRGGTRYIELIRAHFNVTNPDYRLQRPEFIHGKTVPLNITPVANTTSDDQGVLGGFGTTGSNSRFMKSFTEHGIIMTIASLRLNQSYQNGTDKMHLRQTRYDFYWPEFAHLSEQIIQRRELQANPGQPPNVNSAGIAWQERYAEYRYKNNLVTGMFKSQPFLTYGTSLDQWHYADELDGSTLAINAGFVSTEKQTATLDRTLKVESTVAPQILHNTWMDMECTRPMPIHGIPKSLLRL